MPIPKAFSGKSLLESSSPNCVLVLSARLAVASAEVVGAGEGRVELLLPVDLDYIEIVDMWRCNHTVVTPVTAKMNAFLRSKKCDARLRYNTVFHKSVILRYLPD